MDVACISCQIQKCLSETIVFMIVVVPEDYAQGHKLNAVASVCITDVQGLLQVRKGAAVQLNELQTDLISAV